MFNTVFSTFDITFFLCLKGGGDDEFSLRLVVLLLNGLYSVSVLSGDCELILFRQNTYLQNKKHMLTCQVGLVVIDLITSPVVSWRGCETPPQYHGSAVILCSTTVVRGPLSSWWPAVVVC